MNSIKVARLDPQAHLPTRKFPDDAGMDFYALQDVLIQPESFAIVPTGITVEIARGFVGLMKPKGRNDHLIGAGVIDAGYQGEILIKVVNPYASPLQIRRGDAIAQMILVPIVTPAICETKVDELHQISSERSGSGGIVTQHHQ